MPLIPELPRTASFRSRRTPIRPLGLNIFQRFLHPEIKAATCKNIIGQLANISHFEQICLLTTANTSPPNIPADFLKDSIQNTAMPVTSNHRLPAMGMVRSSGAQLWKFLLSNVCSPGIVLNKGEGPRPYGLGPCIGSSLNVEETNVLRFAGDERAAGCHVIAHEDGEQLVGALCVVDVHAAQGAHVRVERGLP